jgi:hypothetical protein
MFEKIGSSETLFFTVEKEPVIEQELFPTTLIIGLVITIIVVIFGLLLYKRHCKSN